MIRSLDAGFQLSDLGEGGMGLFGVAEFEEQVGEFMTGRERRQCRLAQGVRRVADHLLEEGPGRGEIASARSVRASFVPSRQGGRVLGPQHLRRAGGEHGQLGMGVGDVPALQAEPGQFVACRQSGPVVRAEGPQRRLQDLGELRLGLVVTALIVPEVGQVVPGGHDARVVRGRQCPRISTAWANCSSASDHTPALWAYPPVWVARPPRIIHSSPAAWEVSDAAYAQCGASRRHSGQVDVSSLGSPLATPFQQDDGQGRVLGRAPRRHPAACG